MLDPRRHAAALIAVLALSLPATALAQEPVLLAQIEDATPTPTAEQPPLSEEPDLEGGEEEPEPAPTAEPAPAPERERARDRDRKKAEPLPETGLEAGLIALLGLGLIASGSGLRLTLRRAD